MQDETWVKLFAIVGLSCIGFGALYLKVNGVLLATVIGGIAGIAGYAIGVQRGKT